jgi:uncharacterized protein (TIGR02996 family)
MEPLVALRKEKAEMSNTPAATWEKHDIFLRRVHEAPEEDSPRLNYAHWLEERGNPHWVAYAEFIRNQIEAAKLKNRSKNRKAKLLARQKELFAAHSLIWLGPWAEVPYLWIYQRGLPERLHARTTGDWIGKRLGADWGFPDRIEFHKEGRITVDYGDINWPGAWPTVEGTYQLHFTFARVHISAELWQVQGQTILYQGQLQEGGLRMDLEEQAHSPQSPSDRVRLTLKPPDRWWP